MWSPIGKLLLKDGCCLPTFWIQRGKGQICLKYKRINSALSHYQIFRWNFRFDHPDQSGPAKQANYTYISIPSTMNVCVSFPPPPKPLISGVQGDVCDWVLQCPAGYKCTTESSTTNYSCSSVCRFDYCHHHGICTHHPGQLPVCR